MSTQHNNGWVALSERMPTKEDADSNNEVLVIYGDGAKQTRRYDGAAFEAGTWVTHWQPLPPPPETEEQKRARLDEEAMQAAWTAENIGGDTGRYANFCKGFRAALAHARQPESRP